MLSKTILDDIFNIEYKPTDVLIDHFSDELEDCGFVVGEVANYDTAIYIDFSIPEMTIASLDATLVIHRMSKSFEVEASLNFHDMPDRSITYVGAISKDFDETNRYLELLRIDCMQYVEMICVEANLYKWRGLNFKALA